MHIYFDGFWRGARRTASRSWDRERYAVRYHGQTGDRGVKRASNADLRQRLPYEVLLHDRSRSRQLLLGRG